MGGVGGEAPPKKWGLGAKPPSLGITRFVTISVMFVVVFVAFHPLFTPPKTPFSQQVPPRLLVVLRVYY